MLRFIYFINTLLKFDTFFLLEKCQYTFIIEAFANNKAYRSEPLPHKIGPYITICIYSKVHMYVYIYDKTLSMIKCIF